MRTVFAELLVELAKDDPRILLLTGDLGFSVLERFALAFPDRFFNVGVAEQNMVGLATGLAEAGFIPFVYSIATFAVLRPFEMIRNGPLAHNLPVRVVGVGGGFEYGHNGLSHFALEDLAVMRTQPAMTVLAPADTPQFRTALKATWDLPGPIYYRLSKDDKTIIPGLDGRFELGRVQKIADGTDLVFVATGTAVLEAAAAAEALRLQGVSCAVIVVSCLNPAPADDIAEQLRGHRLVLTVETHYINGGLGSLVSEIIAERGLNCRVIRCGVREMPSGITGSQQYLQNAHGISRERIAARALEALFEHP